MLAHAQQRRMRLFAIDVKNAFVKVDRPAGAEEVYMLIDKHTAAVLVDMHPDYAPFRLADGSVLVRIKKALYGLLDAGKLFFDDLVKTLCGAGYVQCV